MATDKMTPSSAYLRQAVGAMPRNSLLVIFIGKNFHSTGKRINALGALSYQESKLRAFAMANQVSDKTHLLKWMRQTGGRVAATRAGRRELLAVKLSAKRGYTKGSAVPHACLRLEVLRSGAVTFR